MKERSEAAFVGVIFIGLALPLRSRNTRQVQAVKINPIGLAELFDLRENELPLPHKVVDEALRPDKHSLYYNMCEIHLVILT